LTADIVLDIQEKHIGIITLNRPKAMNAMSIHMLESFHQLLDEVSNNKQIRVLIITAAGDRAGHSGCGCRRPLPSSLF